MKKLVLLFITVFCMCCMVACGGETNDTANVGGNNEIVNDAADKPVVTEAPAVEPEVTPAPAEVTPEPTAEPTPEPTPDPYPGIDMNSELSGKEWVKTFKGVIDEPKIIVFNDETGRKQIIEPEEVVLVTHEADVLALHLPEGYAMTGYGELVSKDDVSGEGYEIIYLDFEEMSKQKYWMPIFMIRHEGNEYMMEIKLQTQE